MKNKTQKHLNKVASLKLTSGEEIVAKITEVNDNTMVITDPVSVAPGPQGVGLMPTFFTVEESEITVNLACVSMISATADGVKTKYIEMTTGLKIPDKKIIMG